MKEELSASQRKQPATEGAFTITQILKNKVNPQVHRRENYNSLYGNIQYASRLTDRSSYVSFVPKNLQKRKGKSCKKLEDYGLNDVNRMLEHDSLINGLNFQVYNFSNRLLTTEEQKLLSLSLNFRLTTKPISSSDCKKQLKGFTRSVRINF